MASIVAQVAVLARYNGKAQDTWPSEQLTINGLIAILSTICRTAFMIAVGVALAQTQWNRLSSADGRVSYHPLSDFAILESAAKGSLWGSLEVLWRFKGG